jgi:hypothetical protein
MACYSPAIGWPGPVNDNGKRPLVFKMPKGMCLEDGIEVPCGGCVGCRLDKSREWAVRCMHEAQMHKRNSYITLTYSPENTPEYGNLRYKDFQDFLKRLREKMNYPDMKYFVCGEYGESLKHSKNGKFGHPHYHACLFGVDYDDKELFKVEKGNALYKSKTLTDLWGLGHATTGEVTYASAAYVARYVMKKQKGAKSKEPDPLTGLTAYEVAMNPETGEVIRLKPEFTRQSTGGRLRTGGIGKKWYDRFKSDLEKDFITHNGTKMKIPKYYDVLRARDNPDKMEVVKETRSEKARIAHPGIPEKASRRIAGEKIKTKQTKKLLRNSI